MPSREPQAPAEPAAYLSFTLHAHLPYVVNHGTWPHGMEWLHEAAAETYLPLLRVLGRLERDGMTLACNLSLSPVLLEQLTHPTFQQEFPKYVTRKIVSAREDEAFFTQCGEFGYAEVARFWGRFFEEALADFQALGGNIVAGFRRFHESGQIEVITCAATHGYLPLLGTDESVRAQIRTAVATHTRHLGQAPRGIWVPECGYRPAGLWHFATGMANGKPTPPAFARAGVERPLSESHLNFFFVDTHLVEGSRPAGSPYAMPSLTAREETASQPPQTGEQHSLYNAHWVQGHYAGGGPVSVFPRDPRTGVQVWSGETGYPGDGDYLDFHKKRWPGGHRYWRVTGTRVDMADKAPYRPQDAAARIRSHAAHFVQLVREALSEAARRPLSGPGGQPIPPILCAPFDAELFGHWWFEGPQWLEQVARLLHAAPKDEGALPLALIRGSAYLDRFPRAGSIAMAEGSWGAEGTSQVWLNPETAWTYTHLYPAELFTREICTAWTSGKGNLHRVLGDRILRQLCRELLLLESSDWQFLITTGAARDYAELRFLTHNDQFLELKSIWESFSAGLPLNEHQLSRLTAIEARDSIFPDIDPGLWAKRESGPELPSANR